MGKGKAVRCPACEKPITARARVCPHCGATLRTRRVSTGMVIGLVIAGLVVLSVVTGSTQQDAGPEVAQPAQTETPPQIDQVGYYKAANRDRVMSFHSDEKLTLAEICALWQRLPYTRGTLFRGVAYSGENPAPADALTFALDLRRALVVTITPPFDKSDWMFMVNPAGQRSFLGGEATCEWWENP